MTWLTPSVPVPAQNSADNNYIQDVMGNKTDTHSGTSVYSVTKTLLEHTHSAQKVYPTMVAGATIVSGVGVWTIGVFGEIVPASTITSDFDIHYIYVEDISANDVYELALYKGALASEIEIGRVRFSKDAIQAGTVNQQFQTVLLDANERISAQVASAAGSTSVTVGIVYHTY